MQKPYPSQIGDFHILKQVATGTVAKIFMAKRISFNESCCVKIIPKSSIIEAKDQKHLDVEIKLLQTLNHPNIVKYVDLCQDDDNYYLFQEYCHGRNLLHFINATHGLTDKVAQTVFSQLVSVIYYLNSMKIAHRDLKPENLIVDDKVNLKVIDFGLASFCPSGVLLTTFCGSVHYAAPETLLRQPYDGNMADVWSCGVILYAMMTGELPWNSQNMTVIVQKIVEAEVTIPPTVPRLIANLISMLLVSDPKQRISPDSLVNYPWVRQEPGVTERCSLPSISGKIFRPDGTIQPNASKQNTPAFMPSDNLLKKITGSEAKPQPSLFMPSESILKKFQTSGSASGKRNTSPRPEAAVGNISFDVLNENRYKPKYRQFTQSFTKGAHPSYPGENSGGGLTSMTGSFAPRQQQQDGERAPTMALKSILLNEDGEFNSNLFGS